MKRFLIALLLVIGLSNLAYADEYRRFWKTTSVIGSASGSADGSISGVSINPYDRLYVITDNAEVYFYKVVNTSATENFPDVFRPDDVGVGTTSWALASIASGVSTVKPIVGGVSVYNLTASKTLSIEMMGGSFIGNYGANSEVTYTLLPAWKGASLNISLDSGRESGSTIWVIFNSADRIINKPNFRGGTTSGTSYYFLSGTTGAASISLVGKATNQWRVYEEGSPTQESVK